RTSLMSKTISPALDALDLKILQRYQDDTRIAAEAIGAEVGLSAAAVQRRLKRMREEGIIRAEVAQLDQRALGFPVTCVVGVDLIHESVGHAERFKRRIAALPEVQQCYDVTGTTDFILIVVAPDMESYDAFTRRELLSDANVKNFTTYVVLDQVK